MSITELIKELDDKARVDKAGKMGSEVVIDKELIRQALTYLKDYTWRLIRKCPPPEGKDILVCDIDGDVYVTMQSTLNGVPRYYDAGGDKIKNIIAWMPFPSPFEFKACKDCYYNDGEVHAECVICDKTESEEE